MNTCINFSLAWSIPDDNIPGIPSNHKGAGSLDPVQDKTRTSFDHNEGRHGMECQYHLHRVTVSTINQLIAIPVDTNNTIHYDRQKQGQSRPLPGNQVNTQEPATARPSVSLLMKHREVIVVVARLHCWTPHSTAYMSSPTCCGEKGLALCMSKKQLEVNII